MTLSCTFMLVPLTGHTGGQVLDLMLENATVEPDITPGFRIDLPNSGDFVRIDLSGELSVELAVVEQGAECSSMNISGDSTTLIENYFADTGKRRDLDRFGQLGGMKGKKQA
ncbi:MAG: acetolactate decarboxylase [Methanomicrobiales archaeon]|nr:acetolactate decarboxylase [Methanomicrobiales archaeon]